jgi:hypothetical protein
VRSVAEAVVSLQRVEQVRETPVDDSVELLQRERIPRALAPCEWRRIAPAEGAGVASPAGQLFKGDDHRKCYREGQPDATIAKIIGAYREVILRFRARDPTVTVLMHNYDNAWPTGMGFFGPGDWLKQPMDKSRVAKGLRRSMLKDLRARLRAAQLFDRQRVRSAAARSDPLRRNDVRRSGVPRSLVGERTASDPQGIQAVGGASLRAGTQEDQFDVTCLSAFAAMPLGKHSVAKGLAQSIRSRPSL